MRKRFAQLRSTLLQSPCMLIFCGALVPLGFAPFHLPVFLFFGLALFYQQIYKQSSALLAGFYFGVGFFGVGVSWVWNSIHEFGHLNYVLSFVLTFLLIAYLSVWPALTAWLLRRFNPRATLLGTPLLFAALWIASEFIRSYFLSGFPWLLVGFSQIDTPLAKFIPIIGVYGVGFIAVFSSALLVNIVSTTGLTRLKQQALFLFILTVPLLVKFPEWSRPSGKPISVGVIQANLSMRDKWDDALYWRILMEYKKHILELLHTGIIVLPESAIPLPLEYVENYIQDLHLRAKKEGSSILIGIPQNFENKDKSSYYNSMQVLGEGRGLYLKQQLVPFGEYVPILFSFFSQWGPLQSANINAGSSWQKLPIAQHKPFAALICYELAYGNILRHQLPTAQWIVSISDDGWFGRSLAPYQQQQMAQVRSLQSSRYQIVANNDGLSAIINPKGTLTDSLPAFSSGVLRSEIIPNAGATPWVRSGDWPIAIVVFLIIIIAVIRHYIKQPCYE